jgi:hypothetical protein
MSLSIPLRYYIADIRLSSLMPMRFALCLLVFIGSCLAQQGSPGDLFPAQVYPVLEKAECRMCHNDNGVSSATRLVFPAPEAPPDAVRLFGVRLSALVDRSDPESSLLLTKPTARIAHTGGERIKKGSAGEAVLKRWVAYLANLPQAELRAAIAKLGERGGPGHRATLRRLTHSQFNNTVRDLLGDMTRPADHFPQEDYINGFTNQAEGQSISPLLAEAYTVAAERLAMNAFRRGDTNKLIPCQPSSATDNACRDRFLRRFGLRAFRRPLTEEEARAYGDLFREEAAAKRDFLAGAKLAVEAMLQSPSFLFHLEAGADGQWRDYATASRLSYFLWDTLPSDELFRRIDSGELKDAVGIRRTAQWMMESPQARRALDVFLAQWLRFDRVMASARSLRRIQNFGPTLLSAMTEETRHLFNDLVWNDLNFMELFRADYSFVSARLAQHYEMEPPPSDFVRVTYPPGSTRAGVLGHASFLTLTGNPNETSPTSRGLFVREHFLCQQVPPPPPGVDTTLPAVNAEKPMTTRDRLAVHTSNPSCASCHSLIDPIGLGLEGFDNVGRFRDKVIVRIQQQRDAVTNQRRQDSDVALPLDTSGYIQGIADSRFTTAKELGAILANDPTCQRCVVKQLFRYAVGRHETAGDQQHIDALFAAFRDSGFRFRALILDLIVSEPFLGNRR